jgi:hypothetical protein
MLAEASGAALLLRVERGLYKGAQPCMMVVRGAAIEPDRHDSGCSVPMDK